jgi:hypothetical protein
MKGRRFVSRFLLLEQSGSNMNLLVEINFDDNKVIILMTRPDSMNGELST